MALWIDGSVPRVEDMERYDASVSQTATVEGIDLAGSIAAAQDEISSRLMKYLEAAGDESIGALTDVVVTEGLRRWASYAALVLFYRNAFLQQMSERYRTKWQEYGVEAERARSELWEAGLGRTTRPIRKPAPPAVVVTPGELAAGAYFVSVGATDGAGGESESSDPAVVTSEGACRLTVALGGGGNIAGWNIYAGTSAEAMSLQKEGMSPGEVWQEGENLKAGEKYGSEGQQVCQMTKRKNRLLRG